VTAQLAPGARASGLPPVEALLVAALVAALPAHFRARQRDEWTADLLILARQGGGPARRRYLFGAARTLPTLRALARRARADGPARPLRLASPSVVLVARTLMISLAWTVLAWLVMLPGRYLLLDIPHRTPFVSPDELWPGGDQPWYMLPLQVLLYWGALAATIDFPFVIAAALIAAVLVALQRGRPPAERARVAAQRIGAIALVAMALTVIDAFIALMTTGGGPVLGLAGLTALGLGASGRGLSVPARVGLGVLGAAAVAAVVINHTVGLPMVVWFRD
jgi:hypothetical protein